VTQSPHVLLVDDNPGDAQLVCEAAAGSKHKSQIRILGDGESAIDYLHRSGSFSDAVTPDLIILDLNLPRKKGSEVLKEIKRDPCLRRIPVVIFSTSQYDRDLRSCYELGANCYVCKPVNLDDFVFAVRSIEEFWFGSATLPEENCHGTAVPQRALD
jgi:CheY-like chemotaxis protein